MQFSNDLSLFPNRYLNSDYRRSPAFGRRRLRDIALPRLRGQESAHADDVEFPNHFLATLSSTDPGGELVHGCV